MLTVIYKVVLLVKDNSSEDYETQRLFWRAAPEFWSNPRGVDFNYRIRRLGNAPYEGRNEETSRLYLRDRETKWS